MSPSAAAGPAPASRAAGVLLHLTSLPGDGGIGDLGDGAHEFLDWLEAAGQSIWQMLPFQEPGFGASPYGAASSFAGNRLLISLTASACEEDGIVAGPAAPEPATPRLLEYEPVRRWKDESLLRMWQETRSRDAEGLRRRTDAFISSHPDWLPDWALYAALKDELEGAPWTRWPEDLRRRQPSALAAAGDRLRDQIDYHVFVQWLFDRQWRRLREAAHRRGVRLLGDLPIYPALDSADVWAHQELFDLDQDGRPLHVAGVPPDYFSPTGQLWGNPIYDWSRLAADGFDWWVRRLRFSLDRVDLLRLDHFRGFSAYWRVPGDAADARSGEWVEGPGTAFFDAVHDRLGSLPLVAEDLGVITPDVEELRRRYRLPGMKVLQFGFDEPDNEHLPHHHTPDHVVYTATHDNDTTRGWFDGLAEPARRRVRDYLGPGAGPVSRALVRCAHHSVARLAIVPAQDLLDLGSDARMNTPGKAGGNWRWRLERGELSPAIGRELHRLTELSGRLPVATANGERSTSTGAGEVDADRV